MKVTRIGLDIAKQIFELHGVDQRERVVLRKTLKRDRVLEYFAQLEPCTVALEACGGAHYWYRELSKLGDTVRLLPTTKVKPYLDGNKNNAHDAAAICEASSRPSMRFVEPKTAVQQDLQALHRVRQVKRPPLHAAGQSDPRTIAGIRHYGRAGLICIEPGATRAARIRRAAA
jgi:transposase